MIERFNLVRSEDIIIKRLDRVEEKIDTLLDIERKKEEETNDARRMLIEIVTGIITTVSGYQKQDTDDERAEILVKNAPEEFYKYMERMTKGED